MFAKASSFLSALEIGFDNGWIASADAWIEAIGSEGDPARKFVLDPVMLSLAGDVAGQRVLDLGCGEGRFSRMLAARDASSVGLDLVREMVRAAYVQASSRERYVQASGDALPFGDSVFDQVVSYLTLIDITDFRAAIKEAVRVLKPEGTLLVANLNPIATASDGWERDEFGTRLYRRVDHYLKEREQVYQWGKGIRIRNWHRPLSAYMEAFLEAGLLLRRFLEPVPADATLKDDARFEGDFRVPDFVVMLWQKTP
jgi:SAM-dependent methyltransferase